MTLYHSIHESEAWKASFGVVCRPPSISASFNPLLWWHINNHGLPLLLHIFSWCVCLLGKQPSVLVSICPAQSLFPYAPPSPYFHMPRPVLVSICPAQSLFPYAPPSPCFHMPRPVLVSICPAQSLFPFALSRPYKFSLTSFLARPTEFCIHSPFLQSSMFLQYLYSNVSPSLQSSMFLQYLHSNVSPHPVIWTHLQPMLFVLQN